MKTLWSVKRLERLFDHYAQRFWNGRLPRCAIRIADLRKKKALGMCHRDKPLILIDVETHRSDCEIRATLLHEMAHAATKSRVDHGEAFWAQLEKLLRKGAPVAVDVPEGSLVLLELTDEVPRKFPLCRRAVHQHFYRRRRKPTDAEVVGSFESSAIMEVSWKSARWASGRELGLIDADGKPVDKEASRLLRKGHRAYRKAWRDSAEDRQFRHAWDFSSD